MNHTKEMLLIKVEVMGRATLFGRAGPGWLPESPKAIACALPVNAGGWRLCQSMRRAR